VNWAGKLLSAAPIGMWRTTRGYLTAMLIGNLTWEVLQLPLYTIWRTGTLPEQVFAVLHCTAGDLLIAGSALGVALLVVGHSAWPAFHFKRVALVATAIGVGYTVFSEWLNTSVHHNWAYSDLMPIIPIGDLRIGLSPILQWLILPPISLFYVRSCPRSSSLPT
jgi:hypothetical protein